MARYDASSCELLIFTFKEGALAAVAHDLKLRFERFTLELTENEATLEIDVTSLRVLTPMKDGSEHPSALPTLLYREIEKNAADVLEVRRFRTATFRSTHLTPTGVVGALTLHGTTHPITLSRTGDRVSGELDQRTFGIKPFTAMLGALKVKPVVRVQLSVNA